MAEVELWEPRELEELEDQIHQAAGLLVWRGLLLKAVSYFRLLAGGKGREDLPE